MDSWDNEDAWEDVGNLVKVEGKVAKVLLIQQMTRN